ncbi:MAG: RHS repeat protein, partial [Planctomycetes bacterium]|nr:RHS repeat protein [Planctomycetota bacterium]
DFDIGNNIKSGFGPESLSNFPCEDENYAGTFTVPPGDYAYQIMAGKFCAGTSPAQSCDTVDDCEGAACVASTPDYTVHFTVESCQIAACCVDETCIETNRLDCEAQDGSFLGDGDQPVTTCQASLCTLGSCCVNGGCNDDEFHNTKAQCEEQDGVFLGGVTCEEDPCPACPYDTAANCQQVQTISGPTPLMDRNPVRGSDEMTASVLADDVKFGGTEVNQICWNTGFFAAPCCDNGGCIIQNIDTTWQIRIYGPNPDCDAIPGPDLGMSNITVLNKVEGTGAATATWQYSGSLDTPIDLPNGGFWGDTYWFEVSGFGQPDCEVRAIWSRDHGNEHHAVSTWTAFEPFPHVYSPDQTGRVDVGFCENSGILKPDDVLGSCCICPANCQEDVSQRDCDSIRGVWSACKTCAETQCGNAPDNDDCGSAYVVTNVPFDGGQLLIVGENICATDDGPALSADPNTGGCWESLSGGADMHNDVWYSYRGEVCGDLTVEGSGGADMDLMIAIYDALNGCPLTTEDELACGDETSPLAGGMATATSRVFQGQDLLVRVGGWNDEVPGGFNGDPRGTFELQWSLALNCPSVLSPTPALAPHNFSKNRYISIDTSGVTGRNAGHSFDLRLTLADTLVNNAVGQIGSVWWAGCVDADCFSVVGQSRPFTSPDWSACPIVHLTGCPIIPTSTYHIVSVDVDEVSDFPLEIQTAAKPGVKWWGDVVGSFTGPNGNPPNVWTPPNLVVNADDFVAAIKTFQDRCSFSATHLSVSDVAPAQNGAQINLIVNIEDVFSIILGFQGTEYPGGAIDLCPDASCREETPEPCPGDPDPCPGGTPCNDHNFCTVGDVCQGGQCVSGDLNPLCLPGPEPGTQSNEYAMPCHCSSCSTGSAIPGQMHSVYLFSGEFYESTVDLRIPGRGIDFVWGRKYRSRIGPDTAMGNGWDFSYNIFLEQSGANLIVNNGDSRRDTYDLQGDGTWTRSEFFRVIEQNPDNSFTLTCPDTGSWNYHAFDGTSMAGKIKEIRDRNGNKLTFHYDGLGRLVTIHDALDTAAHNRDITIDYDGLDADAHIVAVNDFAGRSVTYTYYNGVEPGGNAGDLKTVTTPAVINTPEFPIPPGHEYLNGKTTVYTYSTGFADDLLNHNLLTITDPKGQVYLVNEYYPATQPNDLSFDRIKKQTRGDFGDVSDIVYVGQAPNAANNFATMKAIVNDRVGNVKELFFDSENRGVMEREYTGRAPNPDSPTTETGNRPTGQLRPGDPTVFVTRYEYNSDSLLTRTIDANGNQFDRTYDDTNPNRRSQGNLLEKCRTPEVNLGGDQAQICESYEYDDEIGGCCGTNFVTKHVDGRGHETTHTYDDSGNRCHTEHREPSIVEDFTYNEFGQMTSHVLPDNGGGHRRMDVYTYYDSGPPFGYLKDVIVDAPAGMAPPPWFCPVPPLPGGPNFALTTSYEYNLVGRTNRIIDPRGHDTQYIRNQLNQTVRRVSREVSNGSGVRYERDTFFDPNDNVVRVDIQNTDDLGAEQTNTHFTAVYEYEILNYRTKTCKEVGDFTATIAGTQEVPICAGLPDSEFLSIEYAYDANRNRTSVNYGEAVEGRQPNNVVETLYDERDLTFKVIRAPGDPDQSTTQYDYDNNRNLIRTSQGIEDVAAPRISLSTYDGYDRRVTSTDPMGNVTIYHYDPNNNLGGFQDAAETIRNPFAVRVEGELDDVQGSAGNVRLSETWTQYDKMDRMILSEVEFFEADTQTAILIPGVPTPGKSTTTTQWSDNSQVTQVVNDNGHRTDTAYDTANRRRVLTDHLNNMINYVYDNNSNVTAMVEVEKSDLGGQDQSFTTTHTYDNLDR